MEVLLYKPDYNNKSGDNTITFNLKNMVSSSSFKNSHKTATMSLNSLPNDLLVEIFSRVASSSLSETHNLQLVSRSIRNLCNDQYVIERLPLHEIDLFPWFHRNRNRNRESFSRLFKRCLRNGNPEALYRKGLVSCFSLDNKYFRLDSDDEQGHKRIAYLAKAAEKGNKKAQYVYGMILICLGDKARKQKGFKVLSCLIKPLMSSTKKEMEKLRKSIRDNILWRGKPMMRQLKGRYVRENCNCDGRTKTFLAKSCDWNGYGKDNDIITSSSSACEICLWHYEVQLFLN